MRISDIKGERSLDFIADAMELVEKMSEDGRLDGIIDAIQKSGEDSDAALRALCAKLPPVIRDYKAEVISLMASAAGVSREEYAENGEVLKDIIELLTSDLDTLAFLAPSGGVQASPGAQ